MKSFLYVVISALLLTACASPPKLAETEFHLTQKVTTTLPAPGKHKMLEHQQLLTTSIRGYDISFYGIVTIQDDKLELMALTPLGIRIFKTSYNGETVTSEQYIPDVQLPNMTEILANIMLAYYSKDIWKQHIPQNWIIQDTALKRIILDSKNNPVIEVTYTQIANEKRPIKIENIALKYILNIKNLE